MRLIECVKTNINEKRENVMVERETRERRSCLTIWADPSVTEPKP
jgi:hypothetical protein